MRKIIDSEKCHDTLLKNSARKCAFNESVVMDEWKKDLREAFKKVSGIDRIEKNACPLNIQIEEEIKKDGYTQIRFTFDSEKDCTVPAYLLIPDTGKDKYPVAIVLQGHAWGGFANSIAELHAGEEDYPEYNNEYATGHGKFAVQAVENGYIALAIEQRGMGESFPVKPQRRWGGMCKFGASFALMLGRTVVGERVWDVHKAIDSLAYFDKCDLDKIIITGNSGGGTASFYAGCFDERIKICAPSCSFCSYETSIASVYHCMCNYMPYAFDYFEMQDLAGMVAPRELIVITGKEDKIFPIEGVRDSFTTVKAIYEKGEAKDNCSIVETPHGHFWDEKLVWGAINEKAVKLGWKN